MEWCSSTWFPQWEREAAFMFPGGFSPDGMGWAPSEKEREMEQWVTSNTASPISPWKESATKTPLSRSLMVCLGHWLLRLRAVWQWDRASDKTHPSLRKERVPLPLRSCRFGSRLCENTHVFSSFYQHNPALGGWIAPFCSWFTFTKPFQIRALSCLIGAGNLSLRCADQGRVKLVCWPTGQTGVHQLTFQLPSDDCGHSRLLSDLLSLSPSSS